MCLGGQRKRRQKEEEGEKFGGGMKRWLRGKRLGVAVMKVVVGFRTLGVEEGGSIVKGKSRWSYRGG